MGCGSLLGGVMLSVTANGSKVRGFKPGRRDGLLKATKICSRLSFGGEQTPSAPCRNSLRNVNITLKHEQSYFGGQIHHFLRQVMTVLVGLPKSFGGRNRSFRLSISFHQGFPCSYITLEWTSGPLVTAAQSLATSISSCGCETCSLTLRDEQHWAWVRFQVRKAAITTMTVLGMLRCAVS
jgi:hypothetical protein